MQKITLYAAIWLNLLLTMGAAHAESRLISATPLPSPCEFYTDNQYQMDIEACEPDECVTTHVYPPRPPVCLASECKKTAQQHATLRCHIQRGTQNAKTLGIIEHDCSGTYIKVSNKSYFVCEPSALQNIKTNSVVSASILHTTSCAPNRTPRCPLQSATRIVSGRVHIERLQRVWPGESSYTPSAGGSASTQSIDAHQ